MVECAVLECTEEAGKWGDRDRARRFCPAHTRRRGRVGATGTSRPGMTHGEKVSAAMAAHHPEWVEARMAKRLERVRARALRLMAGPVVTKAEARLRTSHTCRECGQAFLIINATGRIPTVCSGECARLFALRQVKIYQRMNPVGRMHREAGKMANRHRRRAMGLPDHDTRLRSAKAASTDRITYQELGDRDAWTCWICNEPIPPLAAVSRLHPLALSVDHVERVSEGGAHTWKNVKAAHRQCNSVRQ